MNGVITGIILCGGKSERMGTDKSFLKINNIAMIDRIYSLMSNHFNEILLISNEPEKYLYLTEKVYKDIYPGLGPLSGIHSGLKNSTSYYNFFVSCDMPFVTDDVIELILRNKTAGDIVITKDNNHTHALCGISSRKCLVDSEKLLKRSLEEKNNGPGKSSVKLFDLIYKYNTLVLDIKNLSFYDSDIMFNMNSYDDYLFANSKLEN